MDRSSGMVSFDRVGKWLDKNVTLENIQQLLQDYAALGPLPGIFLPFAEAFFPFLPLVVFVMASAAAFGLWKGFIISWIGTCLGAFAVFFMVRRLGQTRLFRWIRKQKQVKKIMIWVEDHGFGPLFLLLCFPFSPSAIINLVAGLSKVNVYQFILAVLLGKAVMIFTISFIGYDLVSLIKEPIKTAIVLLVIGILWLGGKRIEHRLQRKYKKKLDQK